MELPRRMKGDMYAPPGRYREVEALVRRRVQGHDIPVLFIYAFDPRTRMGPFVFIDKRLIPGAPRAVGSALYAAGFSKVRIVMQPWNPKLRPSEARIDGRPPEVLFVSSMQIHSANAYRLIRDAWRLGDDRPLIFAGGPKAIYEPWDFFGLSEDGAEGADVVVTGEEFVILELMDRILEHKLPQESMRSAFERVRSEGLLEDIPGLVYRPDAPVGRPEYLVNTGVQRLVRDLDEMPLPFDALGLFEPPHAGEGLSRHALPIEQFGRYGKILSMVTTHGCKFHCPYCPIPAYNQFTFRHKSPDRLVEEMAGIAERTGVTQFFGTDDNIFNNRSTIEGMFSAMAAGTIHGKPFGKKVWFATEATESDVFNNRDLIPLARQAGLRSLWFGLEDLTADLVEKGQTPEKTKTVFKLLLKQGIAPMPMMMHHDNQPLFSWRGLSGLLNQVNFLWKSGALTCQVTLLTPSVGSRTYADYFRQGLAFCRVGGKPVEEYQYDGNHVVATGHAHPWRRQFNMVASYAAFYNPVNFLRALPRVDALWAARLWLQIYGMVGTAKSVYHARDYFWRLFTGPVERAHELAPPKFSMVVPECVDRGLARLSNGPPLPAVSEAC